MTILKTSIGTYPAIHQPALPPAPEVVMSDVLNRRTFVGGAVACAVLSMSRRSQAAPKAVVREIKVISHQGQYYHGWPTLVRTKGGQLLLVYSGGREGHICPFGRVELMRSHDDGKTWGWPSVVLDTEIDDRDAGILATAKGTLLVNTFTSLAYEPFLADAEKGKFRSHPPEAWTWSPERLVRWKAAHHRISAAERQALVGHWMIRSADGGQTWSTRYRVPVDSPHGPIQLSDGRLLYAGKELWNGQQRVGVCQSTDDGQSWQWLAEIPARPGDRADRGYHELHAVETANGRIIVQIRNHNPANRAETLQCESSDGGKTWTVPHPIGVWGLPSHLLRLADGRLVMTYGHRRPPYGNQARVSSDHGRTWSDAMILSDDGGADRADSDLGYPSTVQLSDGSLLTVWYEGVRYQNAVLRQATWTLEG